MGLSGVAHGTCLSRSRSGRLRMDQFFAGLKLADTHSDIARNIVSFRVSENLFDDLSTDTHEQQIALQHELRSKPHTFKSNTPIIHRPFEESQWNEAIDYPFQNWINSRFSNGKYGVWYGADTIEASVFETVHHWKNGFLADAGFDQEGVSVERKVYWVRCDAALLDMRRAIGKYPDLTHPTDYSFTQQIGARIHREGHPGLVTKSARSDGNTYAVMNPNVLSAPRQACNLTYQIKNGSVIVERKPGITWLIIT